MVAPASLGAHQLSTPPFSAPASSRDRAGGGRRGQPLSSLPGRCLLQAPSSQALGTSLHPSSQHGCFLPLTWATQCLSGLPFSNTLTTDRLTGSPAAPEALTLVQPGWRAVGPALGWRDLKS